jgi:hypothetical protein
MRERLGRESGNGGFRWHRRHYGRPNVLSHAAGMVSMTAVTTGCYARITPLGPFAPCRSRTIAYRAHEPTLSFWPDRRNLDGCLLRTGTAQSLVHSGIFRGLRSRLHLRVPAGSVAIRAGGGGVVRNRRTPLVVAAETQGARPHRQHGLRRNRKAAAYNRYGPPDLVHIPAIISSASGR